jgi:hypothetical protein
MAAKLTAKGILGKRDATPEEITQALGEGIYLAMREHKRLGVPAVTMIDGKIDWVPAEEIVIPDEYLVGDDPEVKPANGTPWNGAEVHHTD